MNELLQQLVENDLLNEDTKKELTEAISKQIVEATNAAIIEATAEVEARVRVELTEQYQADREKLIEALDTKAEEYLKEEMAELREDINRFRDLEVEYAEKLEEAKEELSIVLKGDIEELVETIDSFLEVRLNAELTELKEDISQVKRLRFGSEIYEAFEGIFSKKFVDERGLEASLEEKESRLANINKKLEETTKELEAVKRERKLAEVLSPLHGRSRDVMEAVLKNVATNKLEEAYSHYIPKVLHEESEKENATASVLAEGEKGKTEPTKVVEAVEPKTVVANGNTGPVIEESAGQDEELPDEVKAIIANIRKLGGIV
jgi:hypothetical protein